MNKILQKRIKEAACQESSMYDLYEIKESNAAYNAAIKVATFILQNQWISVEEALPEYDEDVFVRFISRFPNNTDEFEVGYCTRWRTLDKYVKTDSKEFSIIGDMQITHWMPIPTLKGGKDE